MIIIEENGRYLEGTLLPRLYIHQECHIRSTGIAIETPRQKAK
jgi:hypothetical protein